MAALRAAASLRASPVLSCAAPPAYSLLTRRTAGGPPVGGSAAAAARGLDLAGVDPAHRDEVARVVEQAQRAAASWATAHSAFLYQPVAADALAVLGRLADVSGAAWGGYAQAERVRLAVGRAEALAGATDDPGAHPAFENSVVLLKVSGNFLFDPANHRDFLGACLGAGIERAFVGDVLVQGEAGAQILVAPTVADHLEAALTSVRTVPVTARRAPLADVRAPPARALELKSVEASMRLDAIASAGFRISRAKMTDLIRGGDVRLNWKGGAKPSAEVGAGDVISVAGKGRLEVVAAELTKKGKWLVEMRRLV
jgi:photosystem II S4 domain protein